MSIFRNRNDSIMFIMVLALIGFGLVVGLAQMTKNLSSTGAGVTPEQPLVRQKLSGD
jgi:hypothetical protein